jgi:hypothetical protein
MSGPYTTIDVREWVAMKERAEAVERRILEARRLAYEDAAMMVLKAHECPRNCKCLMFAERIRARARTIQ